MSLDYFAKLISLRPEEEITGVIHQHPISFAKQIIITVVLLLVTFFLMFFLFGLGPIGVALFLALLGTILFYALREIFIWFFNVFIITNQRIIDIDQKGFFNRIVSEAGYEKIIDLSYSRRGFLQTVLKLGTIKIQATGVKLSIKNVSNVVQINQLIADFVREQTGKTLPVNKMKKTAVTSKEKEQLTEDFLQQEKMSEYNDYELGDLLDYYKESLGELRLKKLLVDELKKYEEQSESSEKKPAPRLLAEEDSEGDESAGPNLTDQAEDSELKSASRLAKKSSAPSFKKRSLE